MILLEQSKLSPYLIKRTNVRLRLASDLLLNPCDEYPYMIFPTNLKKKLQHICDASFGEKMALVGIPKNACSTGQVAFLIFSIFENEWPKNHPCSLDCSCRRNSGKVLHGKILPLFCVNFIFPALSLHEVPFPSQTPHRSNFFPESRTLSQPTFWIDWSKILDLSQLENVCWIPPPQQYLVSGNAKIRL